MIEAGDMRKINTFRPNICANVLKRFHNRWHSLALSDEIDFQIENFCSNVGGVKSLSKHVLSFCRARTQCVHRFFFECSRSAIVSKNRRNNATPSPSE